MSRSRQPLDEPGTSRGRDALSLLASARPAALDQGPARAVRDRLTRQVLSGPPAPAADGGAAPGHGTPRAARLRRAALGIPATALLAAAVAAGVILAGISPVTAPAPPGGRGVPARGRDAQRVTLSGRQALLAAAAHAARAQAAGRYWRTVIISGYTMLAGPPSHPYVLLQLSRLEYWRQLEPPGGAGWSVQDLGVRPASPADRAAWRADGSPRGWWLQGSRYRMRPGPVHAYRGAGPPWTAGYPGAGLVVGGGRRLLTAGQLSHLPVTARALRAKIARRPLCSTATAVTSPCGSPFEIFQVCDLLLRSGAPPAVKGAVYRVLAGLPGVRVRPASDPLGRRGAEVLIRRPGGGPRREGLIVDPATGSLLALVFPGGPNGTFYTAYQVAGWVNAPPHGR